MIHVIPIDWYLKSPIDFEHKEYLLYAYLQKVDSSYQSKKVSPYLLHMEKLIAEMQLFLDSLNHIQKEFDKNRYVFFENVKGFAMSFANGKKRKKKYSRRYFT